MRQGQGQGTAGRHRVWMAMAIGLGMLSSTVQAQGAGASGSSVTIYGFLKADVEHVRASGGGAPSLSVNRLSNNLSVLGFRSK